MIMFSYQSEECLVFEDFVQERLTNLKFFILGGLFWGNIHGKQHPKLQIMHWHWLVDTGSHKVF